MRRIIAFVILVVAMAFPGRAADHFGWGADISTTIDVSGHDMSTINLDAFFGYKDNILNLVGAGAGINMMVSNSARTFPVYAILRTSFRSEPSVLFMDLRGGVAFNDMPDGTRQTSPYVSPGIGFNLAVGKSFKSFIIFSYTYNGMKSYGSDDALVSITRGLQMITARVGVTF